MARIMLTADQIRRSYELACRDAHEFREYGEAAALCRGRAYAMGQVLGITNSIIIDDIKEPPTWFARRVQS